jgi:hypothetical protein
LTVAEQTLVGRITGGAIASLTVAQIKTLLLSSVVVVTDTYGILATDEIVICNKATAFTVTLPTTVVGKRYSIKSIGIGTVTLDGAGSDTIDGQLTQILGQWDNIDIACYVANTWAVE